MTAKVERFPRVGELMRSPPITASASETVAEVAARMQEHVVGSVVVVEDARPVGIITERDLVRFTASREDPKTSEVRDWMTPDPDCAGPAEPVVDVYHRLAERGYRHVPVVSGGELRGVVSTRDLLRVAMVEPVEHVGILEAPPGLAGLIVADTGIGDVRGREGFYHYRQYSAVELARKRTLEDAWALLFDGALPSSGKAAEFSQKVRSLREIPPGVASELAAIASVGERFLPLDALRSALSLLASELGFRPITDASAYELRDNALRVCAVIPTLVMALWRLRHGEQPVAPARDLPFAANYLYMLTGEEPEPRHARAVEQYLILTLDHGFNSSTFTARVIASTGSDLGAAIVGAVGALSGPLHGGAPSRALEMLDEIGNPARTEAWVRNAIKRGERIMGFGHRVYKTEDPRVRQLREIARAFGGPLVDFAVRTEQTVVDVLAELKPDRQLYANVEFYAGVVMKLCGIPRDLFTPTFTCSRAIGWCAHVLEQAADNRIIRPNARYVGPPPPERVPDREAGMPEPVGRLG